MGKVRLYIIEEQEILREAYTTFFPHEASIELLGMVADGENLAETVAPLKPEVLVYGTKLLQTSVVAKLESIRECSPSTAPVLLSALYDVKAIKELREFARKSSVGCAYLLKHSIDTAAQLTQLIHAVAEGRVILDPAVMEGLIAASEPGSSLLRDLTAREIEVLNWMSKGYKNNTIAELLCLETKTVERHINNIYSKLGDGENSTHQRVHSVILYLRATGQLPWTEMAEHN